MRALHWFVFGLALGGVAAVAAPRWPVGHRAACHPRLLLTVLVSDAAPSGPAITSATPTARSASRAAVIASASCIASDSYSSWHRGLLDGRVVACSSMLAGCPGFGTIRLLSSSSLRARRYMRGVAISAATTLLVSFR